MRRSLCPLIIIVFLTGFSLSVTGQKRDLTEKEFNDIYAAAQENLVGKIFRLTKTEEVFPDRNGERDSVHVRLTETVPPNKRREIDDLRSPSKNERTERIWIDKSLYERRNNGEWIKYSGGNSGGGDFEGGRVTVNYRLIEKTKINDQPVSVYLVEKNRFANKYTRDGMVEFHYIDKTRYWIGDDGMLIKSILESEVTGGKWLVRDTWVYEYDPAIKIEAPIK